MKRALLSLICFLLVTLSLYGTTVTQKYPYYTYVLSEFDIDESYTYDPDFENFVEDHDS